MSTSHHERIRRALDRLNQGDLEGYLALYSDAAVLHGYGLPPGKESIRAYYQAVLDAFPDAHVVLEDVLEDEDRAAARYTMTATHTGAFMGHPPTGRSVTLPGLSILRFEGGQVAERWAQADLLGLMQQIGPQAVPA
ncbi:MAG: ester cyclase [Rhodothermales bacterium]|nr:ester cyclase [Rhodothermales bacterium]